MYAVRRGSSTWPFDAVVVERGAVLGDVERRHVVLVVEPHEQLVQRVGIDLPAHAGELAALGLRRPPARRSAVRAGRRGGGSS